MINNIQDNSFKFKSEEDDKRLEVVTIRVSKKKMKAIHLPSSTTLTFVDTGDIIRNKEKGLKLMLKRLKKDKI